MRAKILRNHTKATGKQDFGPAPFGHSVSLDFWVSGLTYDGSDGSSRVILRFG